MKKNNSKINSMEKHSSFLKELLGSKNNDQELWDLRISGIKSINTVNPKFNKLISKKLISSYGCTWIFPACSAPQAAQFNSINIKFTFSKSCSQILELQIPTAQGWFPSPGDPKDHLQAGAGKFQDWNRGDLGERSSLEKGEVKHHQEVKKSAPATEFPANPKRWELVSMPWKGIPFHPLIRRTGIILISQHWVMLIGLQLYFGSTGWAWAAEKRFFFFSFPLPALLAFHSPGISLCSDTRVGSCWEKLSPCAGEQRFFPPQLCFPQPFPFSCSSHPFKRQDPLNNTPGLPVQLQLWFQIFGEFGPQGFSPSPSPPWLTSFHFLTISIKFCPDTEPGNP